MKEQDVSENVSAEVVRQGRAWLRQMLDENLLSEKTYALIDGEQAKRQDNMTWDTLNRLTDRACVEVDARGRVLSRSNARSGEGISEMRSKRVCKTAPAEAKPNSEKWDSQASLIFEGR